MKLKDLSCDFREHKVVVPAYIKVDNQYEMKACTEGYLTKTQNNRFLISPQPITHKRREYYLLGDEHLTLKDILEFEIVK